MDSLSPANTQHGGGATVIMHIRFKTESNATRWGNSIWESKRYGLHWSMQDFHHHLGSLIMEARHTTYSEYEQHLHSRGRMIRTRAHFEFDDVRQEKWYLAREHRDWRLQTMGDLLLSTNTDGDEPVINIIVWVDDIPAGGPSQPTKAPLKYHCYGVGKMIAPEADNDQQQHKSMSLAVLMPYYAHGMDDETLPAPKLAVGWKVNNTVLGSVDDILHKEDEVGRMSWDWLAPYQAIGDDDAKSEAMEKILQEKMASGQTDEPEIPRLPPVTFLPYQSKAGIETIAKGPVSLAIRVRTWLSKIGAGSIKLPVDWTEVVESHETFNRLSEVLMDRLQNVSQSTAMDILGEKLGQWRVDIWVMPQGDRMEKLHFLRKDEQLYKYLDPAMASGGDRKLYVELHLCTK